jgi:hypothetical protein
MFNESVTLNDEVNDKVNDRDLELHLNFKVLKPPNNKHEMLLFTNLIEAGQRRLLTHPLCESFLHLKWQKIRKFFLFNLCFYAAFVIILSFYVIKIFREECLEMPHMRPEFGNKSTEDCSADCRNRSMCNSEQRLAYIWKPKIVVLWYLILTLSIILLLKELFQMLQNFRGYIKTVENLLQISILFCVIFLINLHYPDNDYYLPVWKYHVAAIAIFLAWVELMFLIGRFPSYGLYVQMFIIVLKDFALFFMAYMAIIMAFALSFAILFSRHKMFKNPLEGIISTVVMMTGEFEYAQSLFFNNDEKVEFPITAHLFFVLFVLIMSIIMMNLLVGMAVNDIHGLQKTARLERLVRQTQLIAHIESTILSHLFACLPNRITRMLHNAALLVPESYRWSLYVRCNDPRDKRLPRDIVDAAYKLAKANRSNNCHAHYRTFSDRTAAGPSKHMVGKTRRRLGRQRSGYSQGAGTAISHHLIMENTGWSEESIEHIEEIKTMLSTLQLDKDYLERYI